MLTQSIAGSEELNSLVISFNPINGTRSEHISKTAFYFLFTFLVLIARKAGNKR